MVEDEVVEVQYPHAQQVNSYVPMDFEHLLQEHHVMDEIYERHVEQIFV